MAYVNKCEVREAGITEDIASDLKIDMTIEVWCKFIDKYCNRWFESRNVDFKMDGTGHNYLHLNIPIINLTSLYMNDKTSPVSANDYVIYNSRNQMRDDRQNPKIVSKCEYFNCGFQNQRLVGTFGYVDEDGSTPKAIRYAALKLVIEKIMNPILLTPDFEYLTTSLNTQTGNITEEVTDEHSIKYSNIRVEPRRQGISGVIKDFEVLDILNTYKNSFLITGVGY